VPAARRATEGHDRAGDPAPWLKPSVRQDGIHYYGTALNHSRVRHTGLPADFLAPPGAQLNDLYLIVHSVQGLKPGAYFFRREQHSVELLKEGGFRAEAHHLGLDQELPADACVDIFFVADLERILEQYGNRGYPAVQLEAGAIGGRMYLAVYAQRLGATGLTFFDDDVINFFSPRTKGKSAIFCSRLARR
jgi:hypothetical protein